MKMRELFKAAALLFLVVCAVSAVQAREIVFFSDGPNWDGGYTLVYPNTAFAGADSGEFKNGMFSLKMSFAPNMWTGVEIGMKPTSVDSIRYDGSLVFWVKGETGSEGNVGVYIADSKEDGKPLRTMVSLSKYCQLSKEWQEVAIPLSDFSDNGAFWSEASQASISGRMDWKSIAAVSFDVPPQKADKNMTVYVDDVKIISEKKSTRLPVKEIKSPLVIMDEKLIAGSSLYTYPVVGAKISVEKGEAKNGKAALFAKLDGSRYSGAEIVMPEAYNLSSVRETGALEFWIKGGISTPEFYVSLVNSGEGGKPIVVSVPMDKYIKISSETWQKVTIPLSDFPPMGTYWDEKAQATIPGEFRWNDFIEVQYSAGNSYGRGTHSFVVDDLKVVPVYVPDSKAMNKFLAELKNAVDYARGAYKKAKDNGYDAQLKKATSLLDEASAQLKSSRAKLTEGSNAAAFASYKKGMQKALEAYTDTFESRPVEGRGLWVQTWSMVSADEIKRFVKQAADANFNFLSVEGYIDGGYTIWPTKEGKQLEQFKGWDPMKVLAEECEKNGIELHIWFHIFRVGDKSPIFEKYPEWVEWDTQLSEFQPGKVYFVCPAREGYREYLKKFVKELLDNYKVAGIQYDYIRWPESPSRCCFYCKNEFMQKTGIDPLKQESKNDIAAMIKWNLYRESQVTEMVKYISGYIRKEHPETYISAAVFTNNMHGYLTNQVIQDWGNWVNNQYLDFICPMEYQPDVELLKTDVTRTEGMVDGKIALYHGLGHYLLPGPFEMLKQVELMHDINSDGLKLFALNSMKERDYNVLKAGPFREKAVLPHERNTALPVTALIDSIAAQAKKMPSEKVSAAAASMKALAEESAKKDFSIEEKSTQKLVEAIAALEKDMNAVKKDSERYAGSRKVYNDTVYLAKVLKEKTHSRKIIEKTPEGDAALALSDIPEAQVPLLAQAPQIDGSVSEIEWAKAAKLAGFMYYIDAVKVQEKFQTKAYAAYTKNSLCIAIVASRDNETPLRAKEKDGGKVWEDDSFELFIDPGTNGADYTQLVLNSAGSKFSSKGKTEFKCRAKQTKTGWSLEAEIPFSVIGKKPAAGDMWRVNVCRNDWSMTPPHSAWSATYGSFHTPARFGKFIFK